MSPVPRLVVLLVSALVVQATVLSELRPFGVVPDALLVLAVAGGLLAGSERGAAIGFAAGLCVDLVVQTPFGLTALTYCLVAYTVGQTQTLVVRSGRWVHALLTAAACAGAPLVFALFGEVIGSEGLVSPRLPWICAVLAVTGAAGGPLAARGLRWAHHGHLPTAAMP